MPRAVVPILPAAQAASLRESCSLCQGMTTWAALADGAGSPARRLRRGPRSASISSMADGRVEHHAVADDVHHALACRMPQGIRCRANFWPLDGDGVAGVGPAAIADDVLAAAGQGVDELALALVAPLQPDNGVIIGTHDAPIVTAFQSQVIALLQMQPHQHMFPPQGVKDA